MIALKQNSQTDFQRELVVLLAGSCQDNQKTNFRQKRNQTTARTAEISAITHQTDCRNKNRRLSFGTAPANINPNGTAIVISI